MVRYKFGFQLVSKFGFACIVRLQLRCSVIDCGGIHTAGNTDLQILSLAGHTDVHAVRQLRVFKPILCYPVYQKAPKPWILRRKHMRAFAPAFRDHHSAAFVEVT
jgi:hypothetical protein